MNLIPRVALGVTSAVVLGALAAVIARGFAPAGAAEPIEAPDVSTIAAPVIDAATIDGHPARSFSEDALEVSPGIGTARIVPVDVDALRAAHLAGIDQAKPALPADVVAAAQALDEAGGPGPEAASAVADATASTAPDDADAGGDPCADAAPGTDGCPSGIAGAVFIDTHYEPFSMWPVPGAQTTPEGTSIYCTAGEPGDGELWLGVGSNLPATIHATYWPASDPSSTRDLTIEDDPAEVAQWQAEIAATGDYTRGRYVFQHCGMMTDLTPRTDYVVSVWAQDTYGRVTAPIERTFRSEGQPTIPPMFAFPLGPNYLYVGVPYNPYEESPVLTAHLYSRGDPVPSCTSGSGEAPAQAIRQHDVDLSPDYLRAHNYMSIFSEQLTTLYDLPEGSNAIVCALYYDSSRAIFDASTPERVQSVLVSAPDTVSPRFTLESLSTIKNVTAGSLGIVASSPFGIPCGQWWGPEEDTSAMTTLTPEWLLCDRGAVGPSAGAPGGATQNLVITASRWDDAERHSVNSTTVIRLPRVSCAAGDCPIPPSRTYTVALPQVTVGTGMCGSSFGDCTPPARETSLGTAVIRVDWEQGRSNGADHWLVGDVVQDEPAVTRPDFPQFDIATYNDSVLAGDGLSVRTGFHLRFDRPVTYTVSLAGDCWIAAPPAPVTGRASLVDGLYRVADAGFSGLCPGARYQATVEYVDDAGHRGLAGAYGTTGTTVTWAGGTFTTPQDRLIITGEMTITADPSFSEGFGELGGSVKPQGSTVGDAAYAVPACMARGERTTNVVWDGGLTVPLRSQINLQVTTRAITENLYYGVNHDADCTWPNPLDWWGESNISVTPEQLLRGITLRGDLVREGASASEAARTPLHFTYTLRAVRTD